MKITGEFLACWKSYRTYQAYVVLIFLCLIKQYVDYAQLVDGAEYLSSANNLWQYGFPDSCTASEQCQHLLHETRRTVGYPFLIILSAFYIPVLLFFQCLIAVSIPLFAFRLIHKLGFSEKTRKPFMWLMLFYPLQFFLPNLLMPEIWCQATFVILLIQLLNKNWLKAGLSLSFLILLKPVFVLLMLPACILFLFHPLKRVSLLIPLLVFIMVSFWNQSKTGLFHYSSMGTENLWEYNQKAVLAFTEPIDGGSKTMELQSVQLSKMNFVQRSGFMNKESKKTILQHIGVYTWLHIKGTALATIDPGRYDMVAFFKIKNEGGFMGIKESGAISKWTRQPWYILIYLFVFTIIGMLKWVLMIQAVLKARKVDAWILLTVLGLIAVTGPVGSARYLFPVIPVIFIYAAKGFINLTSKYEKNSAD